MKRPSVMRERPAALRLRLLRVVGFLGVGLLGAAVLTSCAQSRRGADDFMGNTNWLHTCEQPEDCDAGLMCICGLCTRECSRDADCVDLTGAVCDQRSEAIALACGSELPEAGICLPECSESVPCDEGEQCIDGSCLVEETGVARSGSGACDCDVGERCVDGACIREQVASASGSDACDATAVCDEGENSDDSIVDDAPLPCEGPAPDAAGCAQSGCPDGQVCDRDAQCLPSACACDGQTGQWDCNDDCLGGACVVPTAECQGSLRLEDEELEAAVRRALDQPSGPIFLSDAETVTNVDASDVSSFEGIQCMTRLNLLTLSADRVQDYSPLLELPELTVLRSRLPGPADLTPLLQFANLEGLRLEGGSITDASPLAAMTNLRWLGIANNLIEDVSPLAALTGLRELSLEGNRVRDVTPLASLELLGNLWLVDNPLDCELNADVLKAWDDSGVNVRAPQCE